MARDERAGAGPASLSRYWNDLTLGVADAPPAAVDPDTIATVRWLHEASAPELDPEFARALRDDLLGSYAAARVGANGVAVRLVTSRDAATTAAPPALRRSRWTELRRRAAWEKLAAALLVLSLIGSLVALRIMANQRPPTVIGAVGTLTYEVLVDAAVDGSPDAWTPLALERWTFQPGDATLTIPPLQGPQWIVADGGPMIAVVAGVPQTLDPGKGIVVPGGRQLTLRNPGPQAAFVLRGVASAGFALENYDRGSISRQIALDTDAHEALPPGASRILFERLTLPPRMALPPELSTGQDWIGAISGRLGLTMNGDGLPQGWRSGEERALSPTDRMPMVPPGVDLTLRNVGNEPLVLLRLTVTPLGQQTAASGTPGA